MNKPITALEAMAKLKAAFPKEYVTVKLELTSHYHGDDERIEAVEFTCYAESVGHTTAKTLDTALAMILDKAPGAGSGDAATEIDRLNTEAIDRANTAEEVAP